MTARRAGFRVSREYVDQHPDADVDATELVINLLKVSGVVQARQDRFLRGHGLSTGTFNVLQVVAGATTSLTPTRITEEIRVPISTATMTGLLDTLEKRELVRRRPSPDDRRSTLVDVTPEGRRLIALVNEEMVSAEREWTHLLSAAERRELRDRLGEWLDRLLDKPLDN